MNDQPAPVVITLEPELVSKKTGAEMLGIGVDKLEELMRAGAIVPKSIGSRVVFPVSEIRRFAKDLPSWEPRR